MIDPLLTPEDVSKVLQVPIKTLYRWRHHGTGPPAIRVGRHLRYRSTDLTAYLDDLDQDQPNRLR